MVNYIYMSVDGWRAPDEMSRLVYFKVGYSKHPKYRGSQLSYEARRKFGIDCSLAVSEQHIYPVGDKDIAKRVEAYVLEKVRALAHQTIGREYFVITQRNRDLCHMLLPQWCAEALAQ